MKYVPLLSLLPLTLAACSSPPPEADKATETAAQQTTATAETTPPASETVKPPAATTLVATAPQAAKICLTCHKVDKDAGNAIGPNLFGIFGRKAGQVSGYAYTDANKNSGFTWDEATLDKYLTAPMKEVPGTKMTFAGYPDAAKRKEVIDWLKTLK